MKLNRYNVIGGIMISIPIAAYLIGMFIDLGLILGLVALGVIVVLVGLGVGGGLLIAKGMDRGSED